MYDYAYKTCIMLYSFDWILNESGFFIDFRGKFSVIVNNEEDTLSVRSIK